MKCPGCGDNTDKKEDRAWEDSPFCIFCCCEDCSDMEE